MAWTNSKPSDSDLLRDFARQWREDKKSLTSYFDSFVYWSSTGSAGVPVNTGRIVICDRSELSSTGQAGLYYVDDEERFVYQNSSGSQAVIGSGSAVYSILTLAGTSRNQPTIKPDCRTVVEYGSTTTTNGTVLMANVTFKNTYAVAPRVFVTSSSTQPTVSSAASYLVAIDRLSTSGFTCLAQWVTASTNTVNDIRWIWRSIGTVAL